MSLEAANFRIKKKNTSFVLAIITEEANTELIIEFHLLHLEALAFNSLKTVIVWLSWMFYEKIPWYFEESRCNLIRKIKNKSLKSEIPQISAANPDNKLWKWSYLTSSKTQSKFNHSSLRSLKFLYKNKRSKLNCPLKSFYNSFHTKSI